MGYNNARVHGNSIEIQHIRMIQKSSADNQYDLPYILVLYRQGGSELG